MYAWNFYLTRDLEALTGHLNASFWVQPVIHGAFLQRRCGLFGRALTLTVVARRSRRLAGTRYLKRGVSDSGAVANDVEVEQVRKRPLRC
jgi:phosphatidylinositol 3,5-bisphosphate 5-phosphatase